MIQEANQLGLIISAGVVRHRNPMRQLVRCTGWPLLSEATTWLLRRELLMHVPRLTLFWLEHEDRVAATAKLMAWLREMYPAVWRAVVAYQLDGDLELAVRSSGAQLFFPADASICDLLEESLLPLIRDEPQQRGVASEAPLPSKSGRRGQRTAPNSRGRFLRHLHPP